MTAPVYADVADNVVLLSRELEVSWYSWAAATTNKGGGLALGVGNSWQMLACQHHANSPNEHVGTVSLPTFANICQSMCQSSSFCELACQPAVTQHVGLPMHPQATMSHSSSAASNHPPSTDTLVRESQSLQHTLLRDHRRDKPLSIVCACQRLLCAVSWEAYTRIAVYRTSLPDDPGS